MINAFLFLSSLIPTLSASWTTHYEEVDFSGLPACVTDNCSFDNPAEFGCPAGSYDTVSKECICGCEAPYPWASGCSEESL